MKKKLINEIRRFQKIAGLISEMELGLKPDQLEEDDYDMGTPSGDTDAMNIAEVDIDLSTTPRFNQEPNLSDKDFLSFVWNSIGDWIEHKFGAIDPASRRGAVEQFLNSVPDSDLRDYWGDYIERKRRGIEENDIDLSDTPEFFSEPDMWDESFRSFVWDIVGDYYEELYGTIDLDDVDDIIGQYLMNLPYDKLKALWGDYTKHKRAGLKESSIDLSNTPEFTNEKKEFYVYDIEGMEAPFGPFTQEKAYKVMKKLKNDSGEDYGVVNGKVAREIWGLQEDIDLSDIPKFNEGSFKAIFKPLLRREGIQDDRYYNLVLHGYMENELLKKVRGKDIPEAYEKIVTDYDWAGRGNVQHLEDAIENLGIEEGFPEGCLEPSPSGGIVSLLVSEDTVLDIVEASLKENDINLSDTPQFTSLNKSKIQREFEKAGVNVKRPIFVYSTYRLFGDYGIGERSVGEYIDDILNTIDDLESDPHYGDSYGDVELKIVSNPDDVDPFDYFVEDDPKDIKLKVLIEGAVHDLIFQK